MHTFGRNSTKWAAALLIGAFATAPAYANDGERHLWHPWFELGGYYNSDDASRGEGILFAPLMHGDREMLFTDIRMKFFEDDVQEGNFALGYRVMSTSGFNFGVWIGADIRETQQDNRFAQLSGGFEALSNNFDFRLNWYGPGTDARQGGVGFTQAFLAGNNIFIVGGEEISMKGVDGEIGVRFPVELLNINPNRFELRAYGGGFYFDDADATQEIAGGKARIVLAINDVVPQIPGSRLTAEYEYSYDDVREDRHELGGRLRIPLSAPATTTALSQMSPQERRMMDGLERDTDIITAKSKRENVEDVLTGVDFDRVAFVNGGGSITNTSNTAGANSLLIVNGTVNGPQTVRGNQTVQGGGSTIQVRGLRTGAVTGFTAPGSTPRVTSPAGDVLALQGNNIHIHGLRIDGQGTSNNGIFGGSNRSNIVIGANTITNTGNDGISFNDNNDNIRILGATIRNAGDEGIDFDDNNSNVLISGVTITAPNSDAIQFQNFNRFVTIEASTIVGNAHANGIQFDSDNREIVIADNSLTAGHTGIDFDRRNTGVTISGNSVDTSSNGGHGDGIRFVDDNSRIMISNNTIGAGNEGVEFDDDNTDVTISGNSIAGGDHNEGIQFDDDNSNIVISNNTVTAGHQGIEFDDDNTNVTISGNNVNTTLNGGHGDTIQFDNDNTGLRITGNTLTASNEAIDLDSRNSGSISDNTFNGSGGDAIKIDDDNTIAIARNSFLGAIGGQLLDVDGNGNVLSGAGNTSNVAITCQSGTFAGTVSFVGGTVLQDGVAPCF